MEIYWKPGDLWEMSGMGDMVIYGIYITMERSTFSNGNKNTISIASSTSYMLDCKRANIIIMGIINGNIVSVDKLFYRWDNQYE